MRKLWLVPAVLAVLGLGVELVAPQIAEGQIESRAQERSADFAAVDADIDSFPMVTRLLLTGKVNRLTITLTEVVRQRLTFAEVSFTLTGIGLDRTKLIAGDVEVTDIDAGEVRAELRSDAIAAVLGVAERIGLREVGTEVVGGTLRLRRAGRTIVEVALGADLFPCEPAVETTDKTIVLSCTFTEVPDIILRTANR